MVALREYQHYISGVCGTRAHHRLVNYILCIVRSDGPMGNFNTATFLHWILDMRIPTLLWFWTTIENIGQTNSISYVCAFVACFMLPLDRPNQSSASVECLPKAEFLLTLGMWAWAPCIWAVRLSILARSNWNSFLCVVANMKSGLIYVLHYFKCWLPNQLCSSDEGIIKEEARECWGIEGRTVILTKSMAV